MATPARQCTEQVGDTKPQTRAVPAANERPPLLFLCHRIPYPPHKGDKIRAFHLLRHLSVHFDIYLASFVDDASDWRWAPELENYCRELLLRPLIPWQATARSLTGLLTGAPLSLPYYADPDMQNWVARTCGAREIRHVLVYSSVMAQFLPRSGNGFQRKVIDFVDVDSDKWHQYAARKAWPLSWLYAREARRLLDHEKAMAAGFDAALFVSSAEAALFQRLSPENAARTGFFSNGVDFSYFDPDSAESMQNPFPAGCRALVFTGAMDYWPNVDAVDGFARTLFPALRAEHPALVFYIVGAAPTASVRRLAGLPGVVVTGRVPDVRPYLKYALAAVVPLRVARGVQNKVLEAMAMAIPVLVSGKGLEGIDAVPGEHVLLADRVADYRRGLRDILGGVHSGLGARARAHVQRAYDWNHSLSTVVRLLQHGEGAGHE
ncbi:MAG: TIGR03087 family PEP-CTERM/XrtA system glycosyltransferase [Porticoccaceae bacterium]